MESLTRVWKAYTVKKEASKYAWETGCLFIKELNYISYTSQKNSKQIHDYNVKKDLKILGENNSKCNHRHELFGKDPNSAEKSTKNQQVNGIVWNWKASVQQTTPPSEHLILSDIHTVE